MLTQPILDKSQLQGFKQRHKSWKISTNVCLAASSHNNITIDNDICQHTRPVTTDQLQTEITHHFLTHDGFWVQCSIQHQLSCLCQFEQTNMIPMSQSENDAVRKDECLQLMKRVGEPQPHRGVLVMELKAILEDLLFSKEAEQEKPLLGFAKMNRSQLADKARQLQIPISENHARGHLIKSIREDLIEAVNTEGLGRPGFRQARNQDVSESSMSSVAILQRAFVAHAWFAIAL